MDERVFRRCAVRRRLIASKAVGRLSPTFDVLPQPDMSVAESSDRFGEFFVAPTPVVDDLRPRNSNATRYLHSIDEIVDVYLLSHGTNTT
jgi:hypothetical protein